MSAHRPSPVAPSPSDAVQPAVQVAAIPWILHVDMDAFYASVEQLDNPALRGKPVIVGHGARGVVSAASYEARAFGVRSAMPVGMAQRLCPQGIFVAGNHQRYAAVSRQVMATLEQFSPQVEQASIDEAYMDATGLERLFGPIEALAARIKQAVREATGGLTCSIGGAPVKFLAKIASDVRKPDGVFLLYPADVADFLATLPVAKVPGVGKHFLEALRTLGVQTAGQVLQCPLDFWQRRFGKAGVRLFERAQGIDRRTVAPRAAPKSESAEHTFTRDVADPTVLRQALLRHAERVGTRLRAQRLAGRTVTLKVKLADFSLLTRSKNLPQRSNSTETLFETACTLLDALELPQKVRLIGLGVSGFYGGEEQLPLFPAVQHNEAKRQQLDAAVDALRQRFGRTAVIRGRLFDDDA